MSYRKDKLMIDGHTDTHIHTHTQATTIPEGQNWPRVKMKVLMASNTWWLDGIFQNVWQDDAKYLDTQELIFFNGISAYQV